MEHYDYEPEYEQVGWDVHDNQPVVRILKDGPEDQYKVFYWLCRQEKSTKATLALFTFIAQNAHNWKMRLLRSQAIEVLGFSKSTYQRAKEQLEEFKILRLSDDWIRTSSGKMIRLWNFDLIHKAVEIAREETSTHR